MTAIQWLLLILIIAVVAGIYFYVRHQAADNPWEDMEHGDDDDRDDSYVVGVRTLGADGVAKAAPEPAADTQVEATDANPDAGGAAADPEPVVEARNVSGARKAVGKSPKPASGDDKLIVLHVSCRGDEFFDGPDIHAALQKATLEFGAHDIYHRIDPQSGQSVFAIANMIKPGTLDPVDQDHLSTPGLTLFLKLPGPWDGARALRDMLETSGVLAQQLGGEVLDDGRALLKPQTAQFMLDDVAEMDRKQRLRQKQ